MLHAEPHLHLPTRHQFRLLAVRLLGVGVLLVTLAAHVVAAAAFFILLFLSGSGLFDAATLLGAAAAIAGVWSLRRTHPYEAMLLAWVAAAGVVGAVMLADWLGLLGA
jgi:hypothetical protein